MALSETIAAFIIYLLTSLFNSLGSLHSAPRNFNRGPVGPHYLLRLRSCRCGGRRNNGDELNGSKCPGRLLYRVIYGVQ